VPHQAFVLAAGLGTRLRPLTDVLPKPLVPVSGVPMLSYALALCARHGLTDVVVNVHWLAPTLRPWAGLHEGVFVTISEELPEILGTGGGLKKVADQMAPQFAVVNADVLSDVDLGALIAATPTGGGALALRRSDEAARYGVVAADEAGVVARLTTVASAEPVGVVDGSTHFTGIHALDRESLNRVPDGFSCIVRTAYRALVPERRVVGRVHDGTWLDVGDPEAYLDANAAVLDGDVTLPLDPLMRAAWARSRRREAGDRSVVDGVSVEGSAWVGVGARVARGASLCRTAIGRGAVVPADTRLVDCVVWDGVTVPPGDHVRRVFAVH
jgi:mannose-1-phosphate guanylyltransferase